MVLTRGVAALALAWSMAACDSAPPSASADAATTVVARWVADDGSIVALNVALGPDADRRHLPELARVFRERHPGARVIVTFFPANAGPERFVIGHIPLRADGGPLPGDRPSSALARFDFRASPAATDDGSRIDGPDRRIGGADLEPRAGE